MYRPMQFVNLYGKRGFRILNRYKSNYGSMNKFYLNIWLQYDSSSETEQIFIEFDGLSIPIKPNKFMFTIPPVEMIDNVSLTMDEKYEAVSFKRSTRKIKTLRKWVKPLIESENPALIYVFKVISEKDEKENDVLFLKLQPTLDSSNEFLLVKTICKTPINFINKSGVV